MIENALHFIKKELSVGSVWQNIAAYAILALLIGIVLVQQEILKKRQ